MDVRNMSPEDNRFTGGVLDAQNFDGDETNFVFGQQGQPGAATGIVSDLGLVTQFTTTPVPEPSTFAFAGLALLVLFRRKRMQ